MRVTWRDGITTLTTAGAVVFERAYFHNWDWPLMSSIRWAVVIIAALTAASLLASYILDTSKEKVWTGFASFFAGVAVILTAGGLIFVKTDFLVLLMLNAVLFWATSMVYHVMAHAPMTHSHA